MAQAISQNELFETLPVPVALRRMIVPAAISQIIVLIYNMADTFYIGRTNNPYMLAGASLILPVFNMLLCLSSLAGIGGGTLISRLLGAGQQAEARKVSAFSFWLAVTLSLAFSVGLGVGMTPALTFLGAGENIFLYARQYAFCVIVLGASPPCCPTVWPAGISLWCCGASGKPRCSPPTRAPACPSPGTWRPSLGWAFLRRWPACCSIWTTWSSTN